MRLVLEKNKNNSQKEPVSVAVRRYEIRVRNTGERSITVSRLMAVLASELVNNAELLEGDAIGQDTLDRVRDNLLYYAGFLRAEF